MKVPESADQASVPAPAREETVGVKMEEGEVYFEMQAGGRARTANANELDLTSSARRCMCTHTSVVGMGRGIVGRLGRAATFKVDPLHSRVAQGNFVLISSKLSPVVVLVQRLCKVTESHAGDWNCDSLCANSNLLMLHLHNSIDTGYQYYSSILPQCILFN